MIIAPTDTGYRFVTQPDHAKLAAAFARHWGSEAFGRPEPLGAVLVATELHDAGWTAYDRQPRLDSAGHPIGFTEVPADTWIDLYDEGIDAVIEIDPYAGLLVSMHGTGLRRRRYGLSPSWPDTPDRFKQFVEEHEAKQQALVDRLLTNGDPRISPLDKQVLTSLHDSGRVDDRTDSKLWNNYKLLQAWDTLSLAFCTAVSGPSSQRIGSVPRQHGGDEVILTVESRGTARFSVDPYPFDSRPLRVSVPFRTVEGTGFETEIELVRAYFRSERQQATFTFVSTA